MQLPAAIAAIALAATPAAAASGWDGAYAYTHDGGRTAGGSPILVTWRFTLQGDRCEVRGEGFQTREALICSVQATPAGLDVRFLRYPPASAGLRFGVETFRPGAPLFSLSKSKAGLLTRWTGLAFDEGLVGEPAPYFRKASQ